MLQSGQTFAENYVVKYYVSSGSYGAVYAVTDRRSGEECVLKIEDADTKYQAIIWEAKLL